MFLVHFYRQMQNQISSSLSHTLLRKTADINKKKSAAKEIQISPQKETLKQLGFDVRLLSFVFLMKILCCIMIKQTFLNSRNQCLAIVQKYDFLRLKFCVTRKATPFSYSNSIVHQGSSYLLVSFQFTYAPILGDIFTKVI